MARHLPLRRLSYQWHSYRDFNDYVNSYEGPYDFHSEAELPQLEAKLRDIKAGGGANEHQYLMGHLYIVSYPS